MTNVDEYYKGARGGAARYGSNRGENGSNREETSKQRQVTELGNVGSVSGVSSGSAPIVLDLDEVMAGGVPSAFSREDKKGATVRGIVEKVEAQQQRSFETGAPEFWPDGKPKVQIVVTVNAVECPDGGRGKRMVYVKGRGISLFRDACTRAGVGLYPRTGDWLRVTLVDLEPSRVRGYNPRKVYEYEVTAGEDEGDSPSF